MDRNERTEAGDFIYRYPEHTNSEEGRKWRIPVMDPEAEELIDAHIEKYIAGDAEVMVMHEIASDLVHIDVHIVPSTPERNCYTLVTSGMSTLPMNIDPRANPDETSYAELIMSLPADWPLDITEGKTLTESDDKSTWPILMLKWLAHFPHDYNTWLGFGHTLPNGNPPAPLSSNTKMSGMLLAYPITLSRDFMKLEVRPGKTIHFLSVLPVYEEEMNFKLKHGAEALLSRFDKIKANEIFDPDRPNVCGMLR